MSCSLHQLTDTDRPSRVSVNGVAIARDAIAREAQHHPAAKPILAWQEAARALIVRELLLQEARRLNIEAQPIADEKDRRETEDEALIRQLVDAEVVTPQADESVCRRYYEQNRKRFRSAELCEARHILLAAAPNDSKARLAAKADAGRIIAELRRDPSRFAALAEALSACPSAKCGGNLGQIGPGQTVPEFEKALATLPVGETGPEPVESRYGIHVVILDRRIEGCELPFEAVRDRIASYLMECARRRATAQYIARLVTRAEIAGIEMPGCQQHRVS
jgi:peptidyl-prolyl cis-trans isomerase C